MIEKFLVTGGCGFIGSHLVESLNSDGHSVWVIDDLSTGQVSNLAEANVLNNLIQARVEDVDLLKLGQFNCVFHLAAQASVPVSVKNFYESSSTNILSALKVIDYCKATSTPLIYASSSAIYGNLPIGDDSHGVDLCSPYSADKLVSEIYCDIAYKLYNLPSFGLRFFNVYGPRQDPKNPYSGVIPIFTDQILKGLPINIHGGYQTRDFIYIKDVVRGIRRAYEYLQKNPVSTVTNLLSGNSVSIDELANILIHLTGNNVEKIYQELLAGDTMYSIGKTDKMRGLLNLNDFVSLEDGLSEFLLWMKKSYE
jgi:UDP-glucose 4-epimerase